MKCGLLGRKLGHSYSPQIHSLLGDYSYTLFEKEPEKLEDFLKRGDFTGLNVTIPYKKAVIPYCSQLSDTARTVGAVNTVVRRPDGTLIGHNSDYFGFAAMLGYGGFSVSGKKVLVLGSGGASNTAVAVLNAQGAETVVISRTGENNYQNLSRHADAAIIVNSTPVGMYPNTGVSPIDLTHFPKLEGVLDLIYNPGMTRLLLDAQKRHIKYQNGLYMLVAQAKESAQWFTGQNISDDKIENIYRKLRSETENIVLIGMPGCGKSTVGAALSRITGKPLLDADRCLEDCFGRSIPEIFATEGESAFRRMETQTLGSLGKGSGKIIATGGGCVTRRENEDLLRQNGKIFYLQRPLSLLETAGRPLSQRFRLEEMFARRHPLYQQFADYTVDNTGTPLETARKIMEILENEP